MGAGQIGGIATLLDIDFKNAAGFQGTPAKLTEGQFMVHFMSHAMLFCAGALLEAHVVLTPAVCVFGERYKFTVVAGTHKFLENIGVTRMTQHICLHKGYNHTNRYEECSADNLALLVLDQQFSFHHREHGSEFIVNRLRYGVTSMENIVKDKSCKFYGWGSRRNGYLLPLLIELYRVDVEVLPADQCRPLWGSEGKYLCIQQPLCKSDKYGALCPDDVGSMLVCSGFAHGIMTSRLIDRPCGVGFLDLSLYKKFLTCGIDDSRDVYYQDELKFFELTTATIPTPSLITAGTTVLPSIETAVTKYATDYAYTTTEETTKPRERWRQIWREGDHGGEKSPGGSSSDDD